MLEIRGNQLSPYISLIKSATLNKEGCLLRSKVGKITIDLSSYENLHSINLIAQRISGDGKIVIGKENPKEIIVLSKSEQIIPIEIHNSIVEIFRPINSTGEVLIKGISLEGDLEIMKNWKSVINRCGKYQSIRLIRGKLFASSGGFISNAPFVSKVETNPPNCHKISGDKLIFTSSCEITELEIDTVAVDRPQPFVNREGPSKIYTFKPNNETPNLIPTYHKYNILDFKNKEIEDNIIFDSNKINISALVVGKGKYVKCLKGGQGNGYLLLKQHSMFSISLSALEPDKEYIVVLNLKKLNGNGKVKLGISHDEIHSGEVKDIICSDRFTNKFVSLTSTSAPYGKFNKLHFLMNDPSCTGEILIDRIMIIKSIGIDKIKNNIELGYNAITSSFSFPNNKSFSFKKRFVIVIPSYNNAKWCERNIISTINQNYEDYRVIYTDDCSADGTFDKVKDVVEASSKKDKFTLIKNERRIGALENLYNMIHSCDDDEIVLTLDGDDWLANEHVLSKLNEVYSSGEVWMTYGQYQNYPDGGRGVAQLIPDNVIRNNGFRQHRWCSTHLRTFYSWLFKNINKNDLYYNGNFMSMAWDMAIMFPMLEMSGERSRFINDIMYVYNMDNPINDHKVNVKLQQSLDRYVRKLPKYNRLEHSLCIKKSVGLMLIATGKYHQYIQGIISSADNYFLKGIDVTYYLFSEVEHNIRSDRTIVHLPIEHRPFPFASMDRFKHFTKHADILAREKYLYYVDVDCLFVDYISTEIIGNLVGVCHCGYLNMAGPVETNSRSALYVNPQQYKYYFGGGFSGGRADKYLELARWCSEMIERDVSNGIIPIWHDETAINRYFLDHEPDIILSPSYHYPQGNIESYKKKWKRNFDPKILLLDKNHREMRK